MFGIFSECLNRAPALMLQNPGFVKRVIFPLEIMPWVVLCSSLFHAVIGLAVLALVMLSAWAGCLLTWPLILVVLLPLILFVLGLSWALAALGVYLRDLAQTITIVTTVMMYPEPDLLSGQRRARGLSLGDRMESDVVLHRAGARRADLGNASRFLRHWP